MIGRKKFVPEVFGLRLRRAREDRGWSLRQVSAKCGVGPNTIHRAEHGLDISLGSAVQIAGALGISFDELFAEAACVTCDGIPPAGFICGTCGRGGVNGSDDKGGTSDGR